MTIELRLWEISSDDIFHRRGRRYPVCLLLLSLNDNECIAKIRVGAFLHPFGVIVKSVIVKCSELYLD